MARRGYRTMDGKPVPSVTTVIEGNLGWNKRALLAWTRKVAMAGQDPDIKRDDAANGGTLAHALIELDIKTQLGQAPAVLDLTEYTQDVLARALGQRDAFFAWASEHSMVPKYSEWSLVSDALEYGGTLDLVAEIDGHLSLVDLKTSNGVYIEHRIQLAAYQNLYFENYLELPVAWLIHLGKDGLEAKRYPDLSGEYEVFEALLRIHHLHKGLAK